MKKYFILFLTTAFLGYALIGCKTNNANENSKPGKSEMQKKIDQFAKTEVKYDASLLDENQKKIVHNLYEAAKIIDKIFLTQVYSKNPEIKKELTAAKDEKSKEILEYFNIMFGPFDRLDHDKPFYGKEEKPLGANFYPEDMTKEEFANWIKNHPEDEESFTSEYTVIKRNGDSLYAVPYAEEYQEDLTKIIAYLREAAEFADNPTLKKYLLARAKSFETNDYFESDMAWMDLKDYRIEAVIGPYEVYEDGLFNYKASYEAFVTIVDPAESAKLKKFASYLTDIEKNLPIDDKYKNFDRGSESPIVVVQEVYAAGDAKAGVQTLAFNLPNDERVRKAKGSKKVMLKNIHEAKFEKLLKPIAEIVLDSSQLKYVTFDGFFNHTLMHEISHGVGPGFITVDGRKTEVKKELKETYSTMEECKADILGMFNNAFMITKGVYPASFDKETYATFLAGIFRSIRFGINEAHGGGNAIIYNYLLAKGAYEYNEKTEKVKVNFEKIYPALTDLAHDVLMLQAEGNYEGAKKFIAKYAVLSPSMKTLIGNLSGLPIDIKPVFQIEEN
ncbi:MAG: peptidase [Chlorobi bacterium]|nr:peptidase [Chlorobiota bacterium]